MIMANIQISLQEVSDAASKIRNLNNSMYEDLQDMKKDMNLLSGNWISDASEAIRSQFNLFANRFERQKETIDKYAEFLDLTVTYYDSLETTITSNANNMQA